MTHEDPVVSAASAVLAHVPGLVRHGSKPAREIARDASTLEAVTGSLRSFEDAVAYPPHRAFVGDVHPRALPERPWARSWPAAGRFARDGEIMPEVEFLGLLAAVDEFDLVSLTPACAKEAAEALAAHPLASRLPLEAVAAKGGDVTCSERDLPLHLRSGEVAGVVRGAHDEDPALAAPVLLENLAAKASGLLAVLRLLHEGDIDPSSIDYVIGCGEEAVGDRYQRGGGNMGKSIAAAAGLADASGMDVKDFCAAPVPALVVAGSLVRAGVFSRVVVVAGGSLPKLGMKFEGHLRGGLPVLEDVLAGVATLVEATGVEATGVGAPRIRLGSVGRHRVRDGGANPQIMTSLVVRPLERLGLGMADVDDYATELHNPEITEPQGSGDVPARNYRTIAALAAARGEIAKADIGRFVEEHGMPGYAPTQGHIASAICYLPHALRRLADGSARRVQLLAKGSLFLGRMSQISDGMSVVLEAAGEDAARGSVQA